MKTQSSIIQKYRQLNIELNKDIRNNTSSNTVPVMLNNELTNSSHSIARKQKTEEIISFLLEEIEHIPMKNTVHLKLEGNKMNNTEIILFQQAINQTIYQKLKAIQHDLNSGFFVCIILFLIGVTIFVVNQVLSKKMEAAFINELLLIMCWVFVWKAVELYFFDRKRMNRKKLKLIQLYFAEYEMPH